MPRGKVPGLFVTGIDTEIGKTYVAARIAEAVRRTGCRVGVYKPVASGCGEVNGQLVAEDAVQLWEAAGRPGTLEEVCPQRFAAALAPPEAARLVGQRVDPDLLRNGIEPWLASSDFIIVEGAGGLMSPLTEDEFVADLAEAFGLPLLIVTANRLGTINQTLQTVITASVFREGLDVAGIVLNHPLPVGDDASLTSNRGYLERFCGPPLLTELGWQAERFAPEVDWLSLGG